MEEFIDKMSQNLKENIGCHNKLYCCIALYNKSNNDFKRNFYKLCIQNNYIHLLNYIPIEDINMPLDKNENTCLFFIKNTSMFKYLLSRGANIHHKNKKGETFIYKAFPNLEIMNDSLWILQQVRLYNVDVLSCNSEGNYFIHQALRGAIHLDELRLLIALGIDVNTKNKEGKIAIELIDRIYWINTRAILLLAGSIWINKIQENFINMELIRTIFEMVNKILQYDAEDIIGGKHDSIIENKLKIRDDNLVEFGVEGTNFFTLPYHHYMDALHMLIYGNYSILHPLHKEKDTRGLFESTKDGDKKIIQGYFENLSMHLKYFQEFVARHELGLKTALVDCESAAKKIKKSSF